MPKGFHWIIAAQFISALADHALLIVTIAALTLQGMPGWWAPLLKLGFTLSYVVLAPVAGPLADGIVKGRLMGWMNAIKGLAALGLLFGLHPVLAFTLAGLGAAGYAPAKYGLVTELVPPRQLVRANGWIEVSVVCAALLGTGLGGLLVSAHWLGSAPALAWQEALTVPHGAAAWLPAELASIASPLGLSLAVLVCLYLVAGLLNLWIPDSGARYPRAPIHPVALCRDFWRANLRLWGDREGGRLSLSVTTLFWGVGAALQFIVLRWSQEGLGLDLSQAAYLQAVVAIGVIAGAVVAGRWVPLRQARRMVWTGIVLGLLMVLMAQVQVLPVAVVLLVCAGAMGGLMVVPLNALLQHRGHVLLSAGRSVAVQGFNENASVLVLVGLYTLVTAAQWPVQRVMGILGGAIAVFIAVLWWRDGLATRGKPDSLHDTSHATSHSTSRED